MVPVVMPLFTSLGKSFKSPESVPRRYIHRTIAKSTQIIREVWRRHPGITEIKKVGGRAAHFYKTKDCLETAQGQGRSEFTWCSSNISKQGSISD